mmetsp:Transcript_24315/g.69334  ORF Transcript_24315/g.69334 Transcript_24315/m.69334 type:complete len:320 (+) Transcript_24315:649-1608(+)
MCDGHAQGAVEQGQVTFRVRRQQQPRKERVEGRTARVVEARAQLLQLLGLLVVVLERPAKQLQVARAVSGQCRGVTPIDLPEAGGGCDDELRLLLRVDGNVGRAEEIAQQPATLRDGEGALGGELDAIVTHVRELQHAPKAHDAHHIQGEDERVAVLRVRAAHAADLHAVDAASSELNAALASVPADGEHRVVIATSDVGKREKVRREHGDVPNRPLEVGDVWVLRQRALRRRLLRVDEAFRPRGGAARFLPQVPHHEGAHLRAAHDEVRPAADHRHRGQAAKRSQEPHGSHRPGPAFYGAGGREQGVEPDHGPERPHE